MQEAHALVEKVILPWLERNHPHAELVIMAGSYGRAMKEGSYQPLSSSDVDLVIVYSDLEKGGFKCAVQSFTQEEVGTALGEAPRIMMIDTNVHDLASLHYHDKTVRETSPYAFINVMLDEGYLLRDRLGIGQILQEKAAKFLKEGPVPTPAPQFAAEIADLKAFASAIAAADTAADRQMLGLQALFPVCEYVLGLHGYWRSGSNQAYRRLYAQFPDDAKALCDAFSTLIRTGEAGPTQSLLGEYITRGEATLSARPQEALKNAYPAADFVSAEERAASQNLFLKFMTDHLCEALETSKKRGELAYLENFSATLSFITRNTVARDGDAMPAAGIETMRYLNGKYPELMPQVLAALDGESHTPIAKVGEASLAHMGGLHYQHLRNVYIDDLARVNATQPAKPNARKFTAGFTPKH